MAKSPTAVVISPNDKLKQESLVAVAPLVAKMQHLQINTEQEYSDASLLRSQIQLTKKTWGDRLEKIIRPIYTSLQELYSLKKDILSPMEEAENRITAGMKQFKMLEARKIAEEAQKKRAEEERLERELEEKRAAAERAKTAQMAGRLSAQAERIQQRQEEIAAAPVLEPIKVVGSSTRIIKKWRVIDQMALIKAVASGEVPEDCICVNITQMNTYFRESPKDFAQIPGVELYDDIQIVGR